MTKEKDKDDCGLSPVKNPGSGSYNSFSVRISVGSKKLVAVATTEELSVVAAAVATLLTIAALVTTDAALVAIAAAVTLVRGTVL